MAKLDAAYGYWVPSISMPMFATKKVTGDNPSVRRQF